MKGLRRAQKAKPPKVRSGLDDPGHKARVRQMRCLLAGRRCMIGKWEGTYPKQWVEREYVHQCSGPIDPHHTTKRSQRGHDHTVVPLCRAAHDEAEGLTNEQFRQRWGVALPIVASVLAEQVSGR